MTTGDILNDLPPSAKLVYKVLEYDGPLTQKQLIEETMLAPRTVRYAIDRLKDTGVVAEQVHIEDARQRLYDLDTGPSCGRGIEADSGACLAGPD